MYIKNLTILATLVASVLAAPSATAARHVLHEKRDVLPGGWTKKDRVDKAFNIPVRIALSQSNLDRGNDELMRVSDPTSPDYGKHWTLEEITNFFAPSQATVDSVKEWLTSSGIDSSRLSMGKSRGWIHFDADVKEVEDLLKTKYHYYQHGPTGQPHVACEDYSVPEHVQSHIDFISPTLQFDRSVYHETLDKRGNVKRDRKFSRGPVQGPTIPAPSILSSEASDSCSTQITPTCLRTLYNLPIGTLDQSSYGIVEYAPVTYLQSDLDMFWSNAALNDAKVPNGTAPTLVKIDGGYLAPTSDDSFDENGEADLDLQYAMDLVWPQKVTLYQVGDNGEDSDNISFNNFLDALDASYCTYDGGDNSNYDETFPDPGGYEGQENCGTVQAAAVISTSYALDESDVPASYVIRQCHEYMKLGMAGTSFLYSSGDYGVAGNGGACIGGSNGKFNPSFPGTCPYITSVGATQLPSGASATGPESACETVIYSGGGFSNVFALPSYQSSAVASYFKNHKPSYGSNKYNNSEKTRGLPDVAANGANYVVAVDGSFQLVYGTSASSPTFGSVITLINNERASNNKSPLGFLNPAFYQNPSMFNDITNGTNQGCGTNGFSAVSGWDPVTGLGTPNYTKMLSVLG